MVELGGCPCASQRTQEHGRSHLFGTPLAVLLHTQSTRVHKQGENPCLIQALGPLIRLHTHLMPVLPDTMARVSDK